ncbi:hypothetical protein B0A49_02707 [Cryomyces minteri]|uniref:Major facilitator superfamily (MFS) profile domain-containing protein n=1 Tax=Cryomyces minteri TaxID=331657 RepID=A0A4U0XKH2_9PEZI|nr:hypothetical protein B0A49_02707 [Cryomyces minteri]
MPDLFAWWTQNSASPPLALGLRSSKAFILATISLAVFTDIFLYGVIVPVIPFALTQRAAVRQQDVQYWVSVLLAVYGAALLAASPVCGWAADRSASRRSPLLLGLLALAASTAMLCVGNSIGVLVAGRVLQGISAAVVWTVGLALLVDTVGQKDVGQAMGWVGLSMSMGVLVAPLLGGVVFERGGYNAVFAMAFGLIGVDVVLRLLLVEKKVARRWLKEPGEVDGETVVGARAGEQTGNEAAGLEDDSARSSPVDKAPKESEPASIEPQPPASPSPPTTLKRRIVANLPPIITLLASRRLLAALWGCLVQASLLTSFDSVLPLFVRATFGWTSTGAGLIFLPIVLPSFLGPLVGWLSDRYGPRWLATAGFVFSAPFLVLLRLVRHDSLGQKALLCALLFLVGVGLDLVMAPLMAEITYVVEAKEKKRPGLFGPAGAYAQAYGLFNVAFAGGCLVGPLWAGMVNERAGWGTMAWSLALLSLVSAVPTVIWTGGLVTRKMRRPREEKGLAGEAEAAV